MTEESKKTPDYTVSIVKEVEGKDSRWNQVGVAFKGNNDSITILSDVIYPGRLVLTKVKPKQNGGA